MIAGLRGYWLESSLENVQSGLYAAASQPHTSARQDGINPRLVLNYHATDDVLIYATGARGYRPGGPNVGIAREPRLCAWRCLSAAVRPDSVWNYESA